MHRDKQISNCPSCGAEFVFQSSSSVYTVCKYCSSMIVRHDVDVESIGKMAALPNDMSPIQIGTEGVYRGIRFGIIGRMKIGWEDGSWNEWFILADDGRKGWLAEAQGFYAVSFEIEDTLLPNAAGGFLNKIKSIIGYDKPSLPTPRSVPKLGSYLTLNNQKLKVVDIKNAVCIGSEGELPFNAPQGRKTMAIDLLGTAGEFAAIEIENDQWRIYAGHYVEWDELRCHNLRPLEGW